MTACAAAAVALAAALGATPSTPGGTCQACHAGLGGELAKAAEAFPGDVHARRGLGCVACHGGDETSEDPQVAMARSKGFRGVPPPREVPALCGGCHADAAFMKRFAPNLPTDELAQYRTSRHAAELAKGNPHATVCSSCHGAHGIVSAKDPRSPVYPTHEITISLTTHYLDEAEALCDRVAIVDRGKIAALGTPQELKALVPGSDTLDLTLGRALPEGASASLHALPGVLSVDASAAALRIRCNGGAALLPRVIDRLRADGVEVASASLSRITLEDVFIDFTGRSLREEPSAHAQRGPPRRFT